MNRTAPLRNEPKPRTRRAITDRLLETWGGRLAFALGFAVLVIGLAGRAPVPTDLSSSVTLVGVLGLGLLLAFFVRNLLRVVFARRERRGPTSLIWWWPLVAIALFGLLRECGVFTVALASSRWDGQWSTRHQPLPERLRAPGGPPLRVTFVGDVDPLIARRIDKWAHALVRRRGGLALRLTLQISRSTADWWIPLYRRVNWTAHLRLVYEVSQSGTAVWQRGVLEREARLKGTISGLCSGPSKDREAARQLLRATLPLFERRVLGRLRD